ncbi:MAG: hypothetical protein JXJ18_03315 [Rhodobacteraceae bacterium]|nr:hypothetical protein [Paracoccaceae bacterium]
MRLALTLCTALLLTACVPAGPNDAPGAMRTFRGNLVVPDPIHPGQFEVFSRPGDGGGDFWCAAAEFAENELKALPNRRIYLVTPRGPSRTRPGTTSVVFTVSPDAALLKAAAALPERNYTLGVSRPGRNFMALHGRISCRPIYTLPFDI